MRHRTISTPPALLRRWPGRRSGVGLALALMVIGFPGVYGVPAAAASPDDAGAVVYGVAGAGGAAAADRGRAEAAVAAGVPVFAVNGRAVASLADASGTMVAGYQLYRDGRNVTIRVAATGRGGEAMTADYEGTGYVVRDRVTRAGPRLFRVERTWWNRTGKEQNVVLACELRRTDTVDFYLIPGISYNGNSRWPRARFQGLKSQAMSAEEAADSISGAQYIHGGDKPGVPACTITEAAGAVAGLYAEPAEASFSACSLEDARGGPIHRLWWPQQEQPFSLTGTSRAVQAPWETVFLWPGDSATRVFYVAAAPVPEPRMGYRTVLDDAWAINHHDVPLRLTPKETWALGIRYAKDSLWTEGPEFTGFYFSLEPKDGGFSQTTWPWRFELGFVGQAAAIGAFMLQDFLWNAAEDSWTKGEKALDFWAEHGRLPNGLLYPRFDDKLAWKTDPDVDTRNMGDGAYFYLLAAELADKAGRPKPAWREVGLGICDFFVDHALPDGRFGKKWKADGTLVDPDGTIGAYLLPGLLKAHRMTGDPKYLRAAERAFRAYADGDLEAVCCTAGAIDQDTIDKETGYPLLDAALTLYEITNDRYFLKKAEKAGAYLASWQYHYSIDFPEGSPAAALKYDAFGGTSITVGGGGADQGGAVIALGWLRLWKATGDEVWRQRALAAWAHTTTGISDGTLKLNGKVLPAGGQYEGFQHSRTRKSYSSRQGFGTEWLCAWNTAFRLWTLQHWPDWDVLSAGR